MATLLQGQLPVPPATLDPEVQTVARTRDQIILSLSNAWRRVATTARRAPSVSNTDAANTSLGFSVIPGSPVRPPSLGGNSSNSSSPSSTRPPRLWQPRWSVARSGGRPLTPDSTTTGTTGSSPSSSAPSSPAGFRALSAVSSKAAYIPSPLSTVSLDVVTGLLTSSASQGGGLAGTPRGHEQQIKGSSSMPPPIAQQQQPATVQRLWSVVSQLSKPGKPASSVSTRSDQPFATSLLQEHHHALSHLAHSTSPRAASVSVEAAQHLVHSLQDYHFNCLKHTVLHKLLLSHETDLSPIQCLPSSDLTAQELVRIHAERLGPGGAAFYVVDLSMLVRQYCAWRFTLPNIEARFSISANSDPLVLRTMAALGVKLCCSSRADVEAASALLAKGYRPVLVDHKPCKTPSHLAATLAAGVRILTVDAADEVHRLASRSKALGMDPCTLSLVIRLKSQQQQEDTKASKAFSFGAGLADLFSIVEAAANADMSVAGVSVDMRQFICGDLSPEEQILAALTQCKTALDSLASSGQLQAKHVSILGLDKLMMGAMLQATIQMIFPASSGVTVSIDASAHLLDHAATLACRVIGKRAADFAENGVSRGFHYYLDDGCYGSLGDVFLQKKKLVAHPLSFSPSAAPASHLHPTTLWGPTCDGLDCISKLTALPELEIGDWVYFRNVATLSFNARTHFNGLQGPTPLHCFTGVIGGAKESPVGGVSALYA